VYFIKRWKILYGGRGAIVQVIRKTIKGIFFLAFLAGGAGFSGAIYRLFAAPGSDWLSGARLFMAIGFAAYFPIHFVFRRLIVLHVFGHELTHALWSMLFGGRIEEIYVSRSKGGFTTYTRGNFLVTLAPYFFPLYAVFFLILRLIVMTAARPYIDGLIGFSLSFHIVLTAYSLRMRQPDLARAGVFFSISFIYLMNCIVIGTIFAIATGGEPVAFWRDGAGIYPMLWPAFLRIVDWSASLLTRNFKFLH
jgi:hypothetical protein